MNNYQNISPSRLVDYGHGCPIEYLGFFLGEYWLRYSILYFTLIRFGVLVVTKQ